MKLSVMLPASDRTYAFSGGYAGNPYGAIELLQNWQNQGKILRFIVSETPVNLAVLLSEVNFGEQDGTGDVYAELTLSEYREPARCRSSPAAAQTLSRPAQSGGVQKSPQSYTVVQGDTMWAIARKFYGMPPFAGNLLLTNGIQNANIIYPGQIIKIRIRGHSDAFTDCHRPKWFF